MIANFTPRCGARAAIIAALLLTTAACGGGGGTATTSPNNSPSPSSAAPGKGPVLTADLAIGVVQSYYRRLAADDASAACDLLTEPLKIELTQGQVSDCPNLLHATSEQRKKDLQAIAEAKFDASKVRIDNGVDGSIPFSAISVKNQFLINGQFRVIRVDQKFLIAQLQ